MAHANYRRDPKVIERVLRLAEQGKSCREISRELKDADGNGPSRQAVSNIAKDQGWQWGALNTKRANEAQAAYSAERRAKQVLTLAEKLDVVAERITATYVIAGFGGKDYAFNTREVERPDAKAASDLANACYRIVSAMKLLHNFEATGDEQHGAVIEYLAKAKGEPL